MYEQFAKTARAAFAKCESWYPLKINLAASANWHFLVRQSRGIPFAERTSREYSDTPKGII
jgi:hypothetical protein